MEEENLDQITKWRMILGGDEADGTNASLSAELSQLDDVLSALYEYENTGKFNYGKDRSKKGGSERSSPSVSRWLGDIRKYFPKFIE